MKKGGLKLIIQKAKIMASSPIISWQINGETVADFILGGSKSLQMVIAAMKLKDTYSFSFFLILFLLHFTLQYCIGFAIH